RERDLRPEAEPELQHGIRGVQNRVLFKLLTSNVHGFGVEFGNVGAASGFSAGLEYTRSDLLDGKLTLKLRGGAAVRHSYLGRIDLSLKDVIGGWVFLDASAEHRRLSQKPYYGPGPDSEKSDRTDYLLEDTTFEIRPGITPVRHLRI